MAVSLKPMHPHDFVPYMQHSIREYAVEKQRAGTWLPNEAFSRAQAEFKNLLPLGLDTPNHYFLTLFDRFEQKIGIIWLHYSLATRSREAFIYDFEIFEPYRGNGLGQAALLCLFDYCRHVGLEKVSLHVFAHNTRAHHIYQKLGFVNTDINMTKRLI